MTRRRRSVALRHAVAVAGVLPWAATAAAVASDDTACERVAPGTALRGAVERAEAGTVLCLEPGIHLGPLVLDRALSLRGDRRAIVRSSGSGSTIEIAAPGVTLRGFQVDGSGSRFDLLDAAVRIRADDARVEALEIRDALFGILAEQCRRPLLRDNVVHGSPARALGLRGDALRLWEVRGARVEGNTIRDSRDMVIWYSSENVFRRNRVTDGRYGAHFMYSHGNHIVQSRFEGNVVGIFAMYSRDLEIRETVIAGSRGAAGVGIGAKESGNLLVEDSWLVGNTVGVYLDASPLHPDEENRFLGNRIRLGDAGIVFHGPAARNAFRANRFADLNVPVRVEGRGDATEAEWLGNEFDDYAGYDFDGDGVGDLPYQLRSLEEDLAARVPALRFFRGTPAMALVEWIGHIVPLLRPTLVLEDPAPAMRLPDLAAAPGAQHAS